MANADTVAEVGKKFQTLGSLMDERIRRLWAACEAAALGRGGVTAVAEATGMSRTTIRAGGASQTSQSARQEAPQRLGGPGRAVHPWRPSISAALDLQEYSSSRGRVGWPRTSGQLPHGGCFASWTGLQSAGQPKDVPLSWDARGGFSSRPQRPVRAHQQESPYVPNTATAGRISRYEKEGIGRRFQKCRPGMAAPRVAGQGPRPRLQRQGTWQGDSVRHL